MGNNKDERFQITELFMAKCSKNDWDRYYYGTIQRDIDADDPVVCGKIKVLNGFICAQAVDQWGLGDKLDELVLLVLDYSLHDDEGISTMMAGTYYFLN